jgi:valyl-tRNA synthetase
MDTWATSSLTPQIAAKWLDDPELFSSVFPMSVRPQAHDIVRTWAFYTIVMSLYHFDRIPWSDIAISGHGLSPEGHKVSKSRGDSLIDPLKVMDKYSADAVRYWAAGSRLGEDSLISEDRIAAGQRLVTKLWNVAGFSYPFLSQCRQPDLPPPLLPTDKWVLSRLQRLIGEATTSFEEYDHSSARGAVESYFWDVLADNYIEMVKTRLYGLADGAPEKESARYALYQVLLAVTRMMAPILPYVTEEVYQACFAEHERATSVHLAPWPATRDDLVDIDAEAVGAALVEIATSARKYKSDRRLSMGSALNRLSVATHQAGILQQLLLCLEDIRSVTRAAKVEFSEAAITDTAGRLVSVTVE